MGDFNLPHIDWSYYHATDNIIYNSFLKFVNSYGLIQFVNQPTREDNILDLVLSTSDMSISDVDVFPPIGSSDHNVVIFNTNSVNSLNNHCISTPTFFDWSRANYAMTYALLTGTIFFSIAFMLRIIGQCSPKL